MNTKPICGDNNVCLFRGKQYSNNPFFSTGEFLSNLTSTSGLCTDLNSGHWERRAEKYALESGLSKRITLLVPAIKTARANLYHVDGRLLSFAQKFREGAIFQAGGPKPFDLDQKAFLHKLDRFCLDRPNRCSPYYLREVMLARMLTRARNEPCVETGATLQHFASAFLKAHGLEQMALEGTFPGRDAVADALKERKCTSDTNTTSS